VQRRTSCYFQLPYPNQDIELAPQMHNTKRYSSRFNTVCSFDILVLPVCDSLQLQTPPLHFLSITTANKLPYGYLSSSFFVPIIFRNQETHPFIEAACHTRQQEYCSKSYYLLLSQKNYSPLTQRQLYLFRRFDFQLCKGEKHQ
jgi:hypothetical protein